MIMVKRKNQNVGSCDGDSGSNSLASSRVPSPSSGSFIEITLQSQDEVKEEKKPPCFKDPAFQHTSQTSNKKKAWRSLKQITALERSLPWPQDTLLYSRITAPPSFKPAKKYSDISGLSANYTDPQTKLYFAMADEFATVRSLPNDIISGFLALRGANNPIG